jgi:hypothetical protein
VVVPKLNILVPKLLMPVVGDVPVVAPVKAQVNLVTEQLSAVVGLGVTTLAVQEALVFAVMFVGQVMVGLMLSVTVTVWVAVAVLPDPSVTVQVTVVIPKGKATGALFVTEATEQLSAEVGVPKTTLVDVQPTLVVPVVAEGAVIVGLILSITVTVNEQALKLPAASSTL